MLGHDAQCCAQQGWWGTQPQQSSFCTLREGCFSAAGKRHNTLLWGDRSLSCTTTGRHSLTAQGCVPHAPQQGQSRPAVTPLTSGDDALTTQCQGRWQCCHQFSLWVTSHSPLPSTAIIAVHSRVPSYASRNLLFCSMLWVLHTSYRAAPSGLKLLSPCPEGLCS